MCLARQCLYVFVFSITVFGLKMEVVEIPIKMKRTYWVDKLKFSAETFYGDSTPTHGFVKPVPRLNSSTLFNRCMFDLTNNQNPCPALTALPCLTGACLI
ncbi:hypothetical protein RRG08_048680 [Elysia crispata]|uniref:Uncharacterized protein n=1 Tax=Elysia crispata TaxID=231223 RepID=A0AAE1AEF7_9GAST|nr:hypothetical protein RRG08_048680 [Elysia crispata]